VHRRTQEQRRSAVVLRESEERYRGLFEQSLDAVFVTTTDGRILDVNAAGLDLFRIDPSRIDAHVAADFYASDGERDRFAREIAERGAVQDFEARLRRTDGEEFDGLYSASARRSSDGEVVGYQGVVRDITASKRAQQEVASLNRELEERVRRRTAELSAANEELEAFSYSVSHDLRAPLRALDGFSRALVEDHGDRLDGQALDFLDRIQVNSKRMAELIDDILALSRVSRRELRRDRVDLAEIARDVWSQLQAVEPGRHVRWTAPERLATSGDPHLLRLVLENLIGNAWKFTRGTTGAEIELGVVDEDGTPTYFVRGNGVGFDKDYVHKLFQPFQRLHRESEFEGNGIGLASVKRIVHRHGGRVRAEGAPGRGAVIWFSLDRDG
jgi:PAS domain S-box-containing protein